MSRAVGVQLELPDVIGWQWELRGAVTRRDQSFAFALPLGARTSAHSSALR